MTHFFNAAETGEISREDWIRVAHKHGVPCFNDAAADVPPISNLWNYTQMGFDLVTFSGGKGMRGSAERGVAARQEGSDRGRHREQQPEFRYRRARHEGGEGADRRHGRGGRLVPQPVRCGDGGGVPPPRRTDRRAAQEHSDLESKVVIPNVAANAIPHLLLRYDTQRVKIRPADVMAELRKGTPSIELNPQTGKKPGAGLPTDENTIVVGVWMLEPGEDLIVARRLKEVLGKAV